MSGSFDEMDVPPTLVSFAIAPQDASRLISPEFKESGHPVYLLDAPYFPDGTPDYPAIRHIWNEAANLIASGKAVSAWALSVGGVALGVRFGTRFQKQAGIAGGVILVLIGLKVLLEHLL